MKPINPTLCAKVLVNRAETHPNMKEAQTAQEVIGEYHNLDLLPVVMRNRIAFSRAIEQGCCAVESDTPRRAGGLMSRAASKAARCYRPSFKV